MQENFERALVSVLKHEGKWSDHPSDPGGATMMGITLSTYSGWLGRDATKAELRAISHEEVATIYRERYWRAIKGDRLPSGLDMVVFDMAVNAGPGVAARMLQRIVGAAQDGQIGPLTLALVAGRIERDGSARPLITAYTDERLRFYAGLSTADVFGRGWTNRALAVSRSASEATRQA
jgi:lysozyme family protein